MATITEDYVSSETAKLLREKGFDGECDLFYRTDDSELRIQEASKIAYNQGIDNECIVIPTPQMIMKWLREVHNIFICIIPSEVGAGVMDYTYVLYKIDAEKFYFEDLGIQGRTKNNSKISYEQVVEAAIKYCLENLI